MHVDILCLIIFVGNPLDTQIIRLETTIKQGKSTLNKTKRSWTKGELKYFSENATEQWFIFIKVTTGLSYFYQLYYSCTWMTSAAQEFALDVCSCRPNVSVNYVQQLLSNTECLNQQTQIQPRTHNKEPATIFFKETADDTGFCYGLRPSYRSFFYFIREAEGKR